jgi:hypothetical protein
MDGLFNSYEPPGRGVPAVQGSAVPLGSLGDVFGEVIGITLCPSGMAEESATHESTTVKFQIRVCGPPAVT